MGPPFTGHFRVSVDTPRGIQPFAPSAPMVKPFAPVTSQPPAQSLPTHAAASKNIYEKLQLKTEPAAETNGNHEPAKDVKEEQKPLTCTTCGVDCTKSRYHSSKHPLIDLCPNCYLDGRFPSTMFSGDFLRLEAAKSETASKEEWTDQETLLLLEGIEMYDEDWGRVADHVGTRSRDQCILKFLQLPIEDPYLPEIKKEKTANGTQHNGTVSDLGPLQYHRVPFSPVDNPILTLTSFLASVVPAEAASEAAKAAIAQLSKKDGNLSNLEQAGATALGSAAAKAHVLSGAETTELNKLLQGLMQVQLKKMELKLSHFQDLESMLEQERSTLERERQQFYLDRLAFRKTIITASAVQGGNALGDYVNFDGDMLMAGTHEFPREEAQAEFKTIG